MEMASARTDSVFIDTAHAGDESEIRVSQGFGNERGLWTQLPTPYITGGLGYVPPPKDRTLSYLYVYGSYRVLAMEVGVTQAPLNFNYF